MRQCIFWLAYNQTPLYSDHEEQREGEVKTTYRSLLHHVSDEPELISRAKDQLILLLAEGHITAGGCTGHPVMGDNHRLIISREEIDPIHWRSTMTIRNWDDSSLTSIMKGASITFTVIEISTLDLFKTFPHDDMDSILAGHENKDDFLDQISSDMVKPSNQSKKYTTQDTEPYIGTPLPNPSLKGEPKPATHAGRKEAHDRINHWLNTYGDNCTLKKAAQKATEEIYGVGHKHKWDHLTRKRDHYLKYLEKQNGKKMVL